jgi:tRNA-dihydrouridine synthase A
MIGREAYHNPYMLAGADKDIFGDQRAAPSRRDIVEAYLPYVARELERGARLAPLTRHLTGLYLGQAGARAWRHAVSGLATGGRASAHSLLDAIPEHPAHGPRAAGDAAAA